MPRRARSPLGATALLLLSWGLVTGVLVNGFFTVSNAIFSTRDGATAPGVVQPQSSCAPADPDRW